MTATTQGRNERTWCCVLCRLPLTRVPGGERCAGCDIEYPEIAGVRIFLPPIDAFLGATKNKLAALRAGIEALAKSEIHATLGSRDAIARRLRRTLEGSEQHQRMLEAYCAPVLAFLEGKPPARTLADALAEQRGWTSEGFEYFYADWGGTAGFAEVAELLTSSARRHARDRHSAVVLGSAAGGLVAELARDFETAYGVDLSLPMLIASKALLQGGELKLRVAIANFAEVSLAGKALGPRAELVAADAISLPFCDRTVSLVTTQYFLDVVLDLVGVAREVHRVLPDGGVWLNYGLPFRLPSDPPGIGPRSLAEVRVFLDALGFEVLELEERRHRFGDFRALAPSRPTVEESVYFFVARKVRDGSPDRGAELLAAYHRGDHDALWRSSARMFEGRRVQLMAGSTFSSAGVAKTSEIGLDFDLRDVSSMYRVEIPEPLAALLDAFFRCMAERRAVRECFERLRASTAGAVTEADFVAALRALKNLGLVEIA